MGQCGAWFDDDQESGNVTTNNSHGIISRAPLIFPGPKKLGFETIETAAANFTNPIRVRNYGDVCRGTLPDVDQVFDPEELLWDHMITPSGHRGRHVATVFDKQILFSYVASHDRGRAYHPRSQTWREIGQELSDGLRTDACFEMKGRLFVLEDYGSIRVYNENSRAWDLVEGDPMPDGDFICTRYIVSYDNKVMVVKIDFSIALGTVSRITEDSNDESSSRFRVDRWTVVEVPANFRASEPYDAKLLFA